jgi:hypothetical protein
MLSVPRRTLGYMDADVQTRERVFELVARHGHHLALDDLLTLDPDEGELLERFVESEWPDLAEQGDVLSILGMFNFTFDRESSTRMSELPESEHEDFRQQPVSTQSWRQLRNHAAHQVLTVYNASSDACAYRRQVRPRQQARRARRSVRTGPRRARAPGRLADDPEPESVARLDGFWLASVRMVQHLEQRRAKAAAA